MRLGGCWTQGRGGRGGSGRSLKRDPLATRRRLTDKRCTEKTSGKIGPVAFIFAFCHFHLFPSRVCCRERARSSCNSIRALLVHRAFALLCKDERGDVCAQKLQLEKRCATFRSLGLLMRRRAATNKMATGSHAEAVAFSPACLCTSFITAAGIARRVPMRCAARVRRAFRACCVRFQSSCV